MAALDPIIHQQTRLQIMACLHRNRLATFPDLRDGLGLTPGNLHSHLNRLEQAGYIESKRMLVDLSFESRYRITSLGAAAFRDYLESLHKLLDVPRAPPEGDTGFFVYTIIPGPGGRVESPRPPQEADPGFFVKCANHRSVMTRIRDDETIFSRPGPWERGK